MKNTATPLAGANGSGLPAKGDLLGGTASIEPAAPTIALDDPVIVGAENIALVIYGETEGKREGNIRRIYHAISKKELPTFKLGGRYHARRSTILRWIEQQESAA